MGAVLPLLIVGAGPFGIVMSVVARRRAIPHVVVGRTMDFWRENMPEGMLLRSACDWHLDPFDEDTIERYLESRGLAPADVEPLSLSLYRDYCDGTRLTVHQIVLATGYQVDVGRIPFLAAGNILPQLETRGGFPVLDERFQSNLHGLYFTSMCAVQDFGPFFAFTVSVRASARVIGSALGFGEVQS